MIIVTKTKQDEKRKGVIIVTRLEFLAVILSLKALLEEKKIDKALELIDELVSEAKRSGSDK